MAPKKVKLPTSWNAKPVTSKGGGRTAARNPAKPYSKPPAKPAPEKPARWDTKAQSSSTKPSSTTVKGPVPRRGYSAAAAGMPNSARAGVNLPKVGARAERTATRVQELKNAPKPSAKPSGTFKAPSIPKPIASAAKAGGAASKALSLGRAGTAATVLGIAEAALGSMNNSYGRAVRKGAEERDNSNARALQNIGALPKPGSKSAGVRTGTASGRIGRGGTTADVKPPGAPKPRVSNIPPAEGTGRGGPSDVNRTRPKPADRRPGVSSNPPAPGSTRRVGSPSGSGSTPRPVPRNTPNTASGTAGKGQQWADFNPNRSTSKTSNPLIKKDDWMMQRMKDREATQQSDAAQKVGNKFDSSSDLYTPSTKVDGSNLDTSKIDQKKVNEYDRRKRRYYS